MTLQSLATDPDYQAYLSSLEQQNGLPTGILGVQQKRESNFNPDAVSPAGAVGIAQFMPDTAKQYGIDPLDPMQASQGQARMLADLGKKYGGDIPSVLAAYNWGAGNVDRKGLANAPAETQAYVQNIMGDLSGMAPPRQDGGTLGKIASAVGNAIIPQAQAGEMQDSYAAPQPSALNQLFGAQQQAMQAQSQPPQISDQDISAELQRRGLGVPQQQQPDISDDQIKQELAVRGLDKPAPEQTIGRAAGLTARIGLQGLMAVPNIIGDAANAGINLGSMGINALTGSKIPMMEYPGQITENALNKFLPQPETPIEKGVNLAGQVLASFGSPGASMLEAGAKSLAPVVDAAMTAIAPKTGTALAKTSSDIIPSKISGDIPAASLKQQAQSSYKSADEIGGTLDPKFTNKLVDFAQESAPQTEAGKIASGQSDISQISKDMEALRDKPLTLKSAQEFDEGLSNRIDNHFNAKGQLSKEGKQLFDLQTEFRKMLQNTNPEDIQGGKEGFDAWKQGQSLWSQYLKRSDVERLVAKAQDTDQPANALKNAMKRLVNSPRFSSYNSTEQAVLRQAAKTGATVGLLRIFGSRLTSIAATGAGFISGGGIPGALASGAIAEGVGTLARKGAEKLQMNRVNKVYNELSKTARSKGAK